jgi:hypothetical protein
MIELIPLIELPTLKDKESKNQPYGTSLTNTEAWDIYQERELKKNYMKVGKPIAPGVYQYLLFDLSDENLVQVIRLHTSGLDVKDSCSLFGGYGLKVDSKMVLYPQCCGLLEEINDWVKLLDDHFQPFYLSECHPSPNFTRQSDHVIINCDDNSEPFFPPTEKQIIVNYEELKYAVKNLLVTLNDFSGRLDNLSEKLGSKKISKSLVWGK